MGPVKPYPKPKTLNLGDGAGAHRNRGAAAPAHRGETRGLLNRQNDRLGCFPNLPGQWLQCQANGSNVCRVLRDRVTPSGERGRDVRALAARNYPKGRALDGRRLTFADRCPQKKCQLLGFGLL